MKSVPTQKIEKKNKKCQFVSRKASGFRLRLWRVLGYDYDQIFGSTDKKLTLFLQYDGNMLFGQSCKLSQEKGQKTWELELIDGLSLTCFLYKKNSFPSVFPFFEYFRKNGQYFLFNPAAGNGFFRVEIRRTIGSKVGAEKEFSFPLRHRLIMQAFYYWRNFERRWFLPRPIYLQHFLFTRREGPKPKRRVIAQQEVRKWREQRSKPHL